MAGLLVLLVLAVVAWRLAYPYLYPTYAVRYELTVEVETPNGIKTGSAVSESRYGWQPKLLSNTTLRNSFTGEATFIDLGNGKNVIITLKSDEKRSKASADGLYLPMRVFPLAPHDKVKTRQDIKRAKNQGKVDVPLDRLPMLITFKDINDPKSVERAHPGDLQATFGQGFALKRVTIEMSDKPVLATIETKLPWLKGFRSQDHMEPGETIQSTPWAYIITAALRKGERQKP